MTTEQAPKLELRGLKKAFGSKRVLDGVDLQVPKGESLVIIGGSGTGKSVAIKSSLGLMEPDAGEVLIDGVNVLGLSLRERRPYYQQCGMLFQGGALFDSMPIWENIAFGLIQGKRLPRAKAKSIALEKLRQVGLAEEVGALLPAELSGGMQKRASLARAIATEPEIIFFDEPTTGLDPIMADVINDLILKCVREIGATAVTITHDMGSVRKIADRVAMLYQGKIIWCGRVHEMDHCDNAYVQQFIHGHAKGPIQLAL